MLCLASLRDEEIAFVQFTKLVSVKSWFKPDYTNCWHLSSVNMQVNSVNMT